jgi:DNA mismatch repair protein MutS
LTPQSDGRFDSDNARRRVQAIYGVGELAAFGDFTRAEIAALGALLDYVELTQKTELGHLARPRKVTVAQAVAIDPATRRNLELTRTLAGERAGSLLAVIDRTMTGAGARLLTTRLSTPLTDVGLVARRLDAVDSFVALKPLRDGLRGALRQTPDLERALARLALGRGGPRDLAAVRDALRQAETMRGALLVQTGKEGFAEDIRQMTDGLGQHNALVDLLSRALAADLPMLTRDGNFIARGYAAQLDELVMLRDDSRRLIAALQQNYAEASGVGALKIRHNNVIGYYIEVTPLHADKLLAQKDLFIHRQSLASAVRFTTVALSELERKITEAADKALAIELQLFDGLVKEVAQQLQALRLTAEALAAIDVTAALAELAVEQNYARPTVDDSLTFAIKGGRHPVVEQALRQRRTTSAFIANDCDLAPDQRLWLLTGPNMAGKSTFLRQNALIALMAQTGSFVPAASAHIGVIDRLFSRVGAADDLARGQSTFMVEMVETAAILNQSGPRALVILDEIGRGTATYDGLSIAWATLEHLHDVNHCRTLFATHYHELTQLAERLPALACHTMRIKEWEGSIIFLHEVMQGTADRSYGIHVGQMAGLPASVVARAEQVLKQLEAKAEGDSKASGGLENLPLFNSVAAKTGLSEMSSDHIAVTEINKVKGYLETMHPDDMTPKDALEALYRIKAFITDVAGTNTK